MIRSLFHKGIVLLPAFLAPFIALVLIKLMEFIALQLVQGMGTAASAGYGLLVDTALLAVLFLLCFLPVWLWPKAKGWALGLFRIAYLLFLSAYGLDILVFVYSGQPVDYSLFAHSGSELWFTLSHSLRHPMLVVLMVVLGLVLLFIFSHWLARHLLRLIRCSDRCRMVLLVVLAGISAALPWGMPRQAWFKSDEAYLVADNKLLYLWRSYRNHVGDSTLASEFHSGDIERFHRDLGAGDYVGTDYPFLHKDSEPDVLGPFFYKHSLRPNVVFIACESLSAAFFGPDSRFGSFVPFLDSLSKHSLYWPNTLSTTERTFGVLPALLGSLPQAEKGFTELAGAYPGHLTLMSLLKKNAYHTAWFHGGPLGFDHMYDFIKAQHPDFIFNPDESGNIADEAENKEIRWGLYDHELFDRSLKIIAGQGQYPRFDVFLTLTTHAPFNIPERQRWERKFDRLLDKLTPLQRKEATRQRFRLAAFLYLDNSLKNFITNYLKVTGDSNTIFLITGDHRMGTAAANPLEKYHVPLLIYSPILKKTQRFPAVACHYAVAPSFTAFFKKNYHIKAPDSVAWVTPGLDTVRFFRNIYCYAFMRNSRNVEEYLCHDYYSYRDRLYRIDEGLKIHPVEDEVMLKAMQAGMKRYNKYSYYACLNDRLIPYSLFKSTARQELLLSRHWTAPMPVKQDEEFPASVLKYRIGHATARDLNLDLQYELYFEHADPEHLPRLVVNLLDKDDKHLLYRAVKPVLADGTTPVAGKINTIRYHLGIDFKRYHVTDGALLKIYFWNRDHQHVIIKSLKGQLKAFY